MSAQPSKILFLIFDGGMDTLDFAGPLETLMQANTAPSGHGHRFFEAVVAATNEVTVSSQNLTVKRNISIRDAIDSIHDYDVLVVPGGRGARKLAQMEQTGEEAQLIRAFAEHQPNATRERVLMSICTGALILAAGGWLKGLKATTHHSALSRLEDICSKHGSTEVVKARFVDSGVRRGLRIITAGGVSSGLDASLYLLGLKCGKAIAEETAVVLEYATRQDEGIID